MRAITIVSKPPMPPHVCFKCKCGEHARDFFVDIGADTEFDGTIYLCNSCMDDLGKQTEMFFSKQVFEDKISFYLKELEWLKEEYENYAHIKELWEKHFSTTLLGFIDTFEKVYNGPGIVDSSSGESDVTDAKQIPTGNVIALHDNNSDSIRSDEEFSGQTITAPVIPIFS